MFPGKRHGPFRSSSQTTGTDPDACAAGIQGRSQVDMWWKASGARDAFDFSVMEFGTTEVTAIGIRRRHWNINRGSRQFQGDCHFEAGRKQVLCHYRDVGTQFLLLKSRWCQVNWTDFGGLVVNNTP